MANLKKVNEECVVSPVLERLRKDMLKEKSFLVHLYKGNSRKNRRKIQNASVDELNVLLRILFCIERGLHMSFFLCFYYCLRLKSNERHMETLSRTHPPS